jgi:Fur family ferric uptake transcriptional regulator
MPGPVESALAALKERGYRMTPQRRAIVSEVMRTRGHISAVNVARRVSRAVPGVNASTVYRTLGLLEEIGVVAHAHLGPTAEYHRSSELDHVHLICSVCGSVDSLSTGETEPLRRLLHRHNGFDPDFTHFGVAGTCASCAEGRGDAPIERGRQQV